MKGHFTMSGDNVDDRLSQIEKSLSRIADALEEQVRQQSLVDALPPSAEHDAFVWHANSLRFQAVPQVNHIPLDLLQGIDLQQDQLMAIQHALPKGWLPIMPCFGERAGQVNRHLSKQFMPRWAKQPPLFWLRSIEKI